MLPQYLSSKYYKESLEIETHYDSYPIEFMTDLAEESLENYQPSPFKDFVNLLEHQSDTADIGSGPGRATLFLLNRGHNVISIDISRNSLRLLRKKIGDKDSCLLIHGNNLILPIEDKTMDAVISDGVIHHSAEPTKSFKEIVRVLKEGGLMYLSVYKKWGHYHWIYSAFSPFVRAAIKRRVTRLLIHSLFLPMYYLVHLAKTRGDRTWLAAKNFFYDYFITPKVGFFSRGEIKRLAFSEGMNLLQEYSFRNTKVFLLKKVLKDKTINCEKYTK